MKCPLCGHAKAHNYGKIPNGHQRYLCPVCHQTFSELFDSLYYRRHVSRDQIRQVLEARCEGSSFRGSAEPLGLPTTPLITRLVVSYFNWIWQPSRFKSSAAQRAGLTSRSWAWNDIVTYPTII